MSGLAEAAPCSHVEPTPATYTRRRPDKTVLHSVVREHAEARERSDSGYGYPAHVENEFRRYIDCGSLARGFLRVHWRNVGDKGSATRSVVVDDRVVSGPPSLTLCWTSGRRGRSVLALLRRPRRPG